jgi:hypothetical protein
MWSGGGGRADREIKNVNRKKNKKKKKLRRKRRREMKGKGQIEERMKVGEKIFMKNELTVGRKQIIERIKLRKRRRK